MATIFIFDVLRQNFGGGCSYRVDYVFGSLLVEQLNNAGKSEIPNLKMCNRGCLQRWFSRFSLWGHRCTHYVPGVPEERLLNLLKNMRRWNGPASTIYKPLAPKYHCQLQGPVGKVTWPRIQDQRFYDSIIAVPDLSHDLVLRVMKTTTSQTNRSCMKPEVDLRFMSVLV